MIAVRLERDGCISCMNCWAICPMVFQRNSCDCRTEIACMYRNGDDIATGEVPDELESCISMAADFCPASVIRIG